MSAIDEYRRKLAQIGFDAMAILGIIADAEARLTDAEARLPELKKDVTAINEKIDNILDK